MIRYVDFFKNEICFLDLIIFHMNYILLLIIKMNIEQVLCHLWIVRAEGQTPLIIINLHYEVY